jgi:amino acid transporter
VYARAAFGSRASFAVGWFSYVSAIFSTSAVIRGLGQALAAPGSWLDGVYGGPRTVATVTIVALAALVAAGLRVSAMAWTAITAAKLLPLVALLGAWALAGAPVASAPASAGPSPGPAALLRGALVVLFALQGFEIVPVPAGHAREPAAIARAVVLALVLAAAAYVGLHLACAGALPGLAESRTPLVDAARVYGGGRLARALAVGTSVSALGIALGMVAMSPRYLAALGRPGGLGAWLGSIDARGVPQRALLVTAFAVLALVQVGSLDELFAMSSIAVLVQYGSTAVSLAVLGAKRARGLGPRDIALGVVAASAACVVLLGASWWEVVRAGGVIAVGLVARIVAMGIGAARHG